MSRIDEEMVAVHDAAADKARGVVAWVTRMWRYMTELVTGRTPPAPPPTYAQPTATEARAQAHRAQADQPAEPNYPKPPAGGAAA